MSSDELFIPGSVATCFAIIYLLRKTAQLLDNRRMPNDISPMRNYFAKLGLEPEIVEIYIALQAYGPQSLLQLARNAKIERTRLYRLLDTLVENHLIEIEEHYKRKLYKAAPISNLQIVLTKREQEIRDLQTELLRLQPQFQSSVHSPLTHVQFYKGREGVKQMYWNQTKAQTETVSILYENMQTKTKLAFFERWVERCNRRNMYFRSVVGDHFLDAQRTWYNEYSNEKLKNWQGRYVSNDIFPIIHSTVTYDDVVMYFNWKDGEIFGFEVYNQEIATAQRQVFEMLWRQGTAVPGHGEK
jgi:sugar-specific transcriptional regulator TrmB